MASFPLGHRSPTYTHMPVLASFGADLQIGHTLLKLPDIFDLNGG
jgi:hypothetical protein